MIIEPPTLAKCQDRRRKSTGLDPAEWIRRAMKDGETMLSFNFVVKWKANPPTTNGPAIITKLLRMERRDNPTAEAVQQAICRSTLKEELQMANRILRLAGKETVALILPEQPGARITDNTTVWMAAADDPQKPTPMTIGRLRRWLRKLRGGTSPMSGKGLIWGTSAVKCYLSTTNDISWRRRRDDIRRIKQNNPHNRIQETHTKNPLIATWQQNTISGQTDANTNPYRPWPTT